LLVFALHALTNAAGSVAGSDIWTPYTLFRLGFEIVFLVGPAILSIWLVANVARSFDRSAQTIAALTTALSFAVVFYGAASAYVTDPPPAALTVAAVLAVMRGRPTLAGVAVGVGAALKLFPILVLPALVVLLPRSAWLRIGLTACPVVMLVFGPFLDYPLLLPWAYFYGGSAVWLEWGSVLARTIVLGWLLRMDPAIGS
jgi:uncharacterized membrane protein